MLLIRGGLERINNGEEGEWSGVGKFVGFGYDVLIGMIGDFVFKGGWILCETICKIGSHAISRSGNLGVEVELTSICDNSVLRLGCLIGLMLVIILV
jgi:hypothetical protein